MPTCPNDDQIRNEFTRVVSTMKGCWVECRRGGGIHRRGTSTGGWRPVKSLPRHSTEAELTAARQELLEHRDYFGVCARCGNRFPVGATLDSECCGTCAPREPEVIHRPERE
jgi:hypothetical protein